MKIKEKEIKLQFTFAYCFAVGGRQKNYYILKYNNFSNLLLIRARQVSKSRSPCRVSKRVSPWLTPKGAEPEPCKA